MKSKLLKIFHVILNITIVIALVLLLVFSLYKLRLITIPDFLKEWLGIDKKIVDIVVIPGDEGKIYASLKDKQNYSEIKVTSVLDTANIRELIENINDAKDYYWETSTKLYSGNEFIETKSIIRYYNGLYRVELYKPNNTLYKIVTDNGKETTIKVLDENVGNYQMKKFPTNSMSLFSEAGVPDIKKFLETPQTDDVKYYLSESEFGDILYLEFNYNFSNYTQKEIYFVSLDYGIPVRCETYENDKLIYSSESVKLSKLPNPANDLFEIN